MVKKPEINLMDSGFFITITKKQQKYCFIGILERYPGNVLIDKNLKILRQVSLRKLLDFVKGWQEVEYV